MSNFKVLEKEVKDICKIKDINFKWSFDKILRNYELRFNKDNENLLINIKETDLLNLPFNNILIDVKSNITNLINHSDPKSAFDDLLANIQSICDDENIKMSYYHDPELDFYSFRLQKCGIVGRWSIPIDDLMYKKQEMLIYEFHMKLDDLYNAIRNKMDNQRR